MTNTLVFSELWIPGQAGNDAFKENRTALPNFTHDRH
jgi:hypothetical protein